MGKGRNEVLRVDPATVIIFSVLFSPALLAGGVSVWHGEHVRWSSPGVKLDRIAEDMSEGRFDSITRETVRAMHLLRLALVVAGMLVAAALVRLALR